MTHEEIEACVLRAKTGSQADLLKLINQYKPFIFKLTLQYTIRNFDSYDLQQNAYIALINSVIKYNTGSHTFSTYAFNSIKNSFRQAARDNLKFSEDLSLNMPVSQEANVVTKFIDCIEGDINLEEDILNAESRRELKLALEKLSEEEMELVIMLYYGKCSMMTYAIE